MVLPVEERSGNAGMSSADTEPPSMVAASAMMVAASAQAQTQPNVLTGDTPQTATPAGMQTDTQQGPRWPAVLASLAMPCLLDGFLANHEQVPAGTHASVPDTVSGAQTCTLAGLLGDVLHAAKHAKHAAVGTVGAQAGPGAAAAFVRALCRPFLDR